MRARTTNTTVPALALVLGLGMHLGACADAPAAEGARDGTRTAEIAATASELEKVTLTIPGMSCRLCANTIEHTLTRAGLRDIAIDLEEKRVTARFDPERMSPEQVKKLVTDLGYEVSDLKVG